MIPKGRVFIYTEEEGGDYKVIFVANNITKPEIMQHMKKPLHSWWFIEGILLESWDSTLRDGRIPWGWGNGKR